MSPRKRFGLEQLSKEIRVTTSKRFIVDILHLHGFKCAGTTFIWSLERATNGQLIYAESPRTGDRLDWRHVREHLEGLEQKPRALTSHLITMPPAGVVAKLKVAFLREPIARILSAYRFTTSVQHSAKPVPIGQYIDGMVKTTLANFQTRHLSPQEPNDWLLRRGWAARPELIDLHRNDLFVGLVERYDESIVVLESMLEELGMPMDLAYPQRLNTTDESSNSRAGELHRSSASGLAVTELDLSLYRRAEQRLEERLAALPDREARLAAFQRRRLELAEQSPKVRVKPQTEWVTLPVEV